MDQVVVVSGGDTGIGYGTARQFARINAQVIIIGRRLAVLQRAAEEIAGDFPDAQHKAKLAETMNGRAGTTEDIANTVAWLASPEACHLTAQIIQINGGAERGR